MVFDLALIDEHQISRAKNQSLILRPSEDPKSEPTTVGRGQCHTNVGGPIKPLLQRSIDRSQT